MPVPHRPNRIFLLSPAHCGGKRASYLYNDLARFELARQVRTPAGAPLGEVFTFLSGLYFRGKWAYARAFASPPPGAAGAYVITTNRGLVPPETPITLPELRDMGCVDIDHEDVRYSGPLERDLRTLAAGCTDCPFILLGSVATAKYVDILLGVLGEKLLFPEEFAGRGDMSRGGLMLRCVEERRELTYVPVATAIRHGKRPPKLAPRTRMQNAE
ncbi:MAG TPA: hypothetical protein VFB66_19795 [Tepidisphaeraceae bacterium]|nr:hypothetical protein [Tepidisphaeraceae bacterium]